MKGSTLIVTSLFASLVGCWILAPTACEWIALGLMVCAGIPHGSFDLRVAEAKWRNSPCSRTRILIGYLLGVFGMTSLCVFFPTLGLSLFLVISALHFSEGESNASTPPALFLGAALGVSAILLPIGLHAAQAQSYMGYFVPPDIFAALSEPLHILSCVVATPLAGFLLLSLQQRRDEQSENIQRIVCLIGWIILPPLAGFAVWFIGRHSRQHLKACHEVFSQHGTRIPLDFAVISALAILGLLPFALYFDFSRIEELFAASLCLIAGLTLPHMIVSHRMKESLSL
ncbi:MAG: hypothetical protein RIS36_2378 [Pseudomonadota bacterium]